MTFPPKEVKKGTVLVKLVPPKSLSKKIRKAEKAVEKADEVLENKRGELTALQEELEARQQSIEDISETIEQLKAEEDSQKEGSQETISSRKGSGRHYRGHPRST